MRRWNGWGTDEIIYPVPSSAQDYLADRVGPPQAAPGVTLADLLPSVPPASLPAHPLIDTDAEARLRHARGQSLPDWVALRFGVIPRYPDGVARPGTEAEVEELLAYARGSGVRLIPYGGGSSVVGHINPPEDDRPVLTVDMSRMRRLLDLNEQNRLATFAAGAAGPHIEAQLRAHGYTLGHFPQSFEYSTLGGWIATRSSGQQSLYYGRIEDLFVGGRLLTPRGPLDLPPHPASAAGPDLRQLVLGSEGRLGFITQAIVRVRPLPQREDFHAVFFPEWSPAVEALRELVQEGVGLSMLRLSDADETRTTLVLAGRERLTAVMERLLRARGIGPQKCLLLFGATGSEARVQQARHDALTICKARGGVHAGRMMGNEWRKSRFRTPYLRNSLWELGYAVDTLETAVRWSRVDALKRDILEALRTALQNEGERVLAFAHLSHVYPDGASIYVTYLFRIAPTADETLARWQKLKGAASRAIVAHNATISHQHGVGVDHAPYLAAEKGETGLQALAALLRTFDPDGLMNPGKLLPPT